MNRSLISRSTPTKRNPRRSIPAGSSTLAGSRPSRRNPHHNICIAFHHSVHPTKVPILLSVEEEEFQNLLIGDSDSTFLTTVVTRIFDDTRFKIGNIHTLAFFVANRPPQEFEGKNWTDRIDPDSFKRGATYKTLKDHFPNGLDTTLVHFVFTANSGQYVPPVKFTKTEDDCMDVDEFAGTYDLHDNHLFDRILKASKNLPPPSTLSKTIQYTKFQTNPSTTINDGLVSDKSGALSTNAPPITIYCPVFEDFIRRVHSSQHNPVPLDFIQQVLKFAAETSKIKSEKEIVAVKGPRRQLSDLLGISFHLESNADSSTAADGVDVFRVGMDRYFLAIFEFKRSFGEGGCDATVQNGNYIRATLVDDSRKDLVHTSCCPMFLISLAGPWLNIAGGLLSNRFIVQRLTDGLWVPLSSTHNDDRLLHLAKVLYALKNSLKNLEDWYSKVHEYKIPYISTSPHPRLLPYPNFFIQYSNAVPFRYQRSLERDSQCVTFLAELCNEEKKTVVVKFVDRYGDDVHNFLASLGQAPKLLYFGNLPSDVFYQDKPVPSILPDWTLARSSSPITANMKMVVMEYVEPSPSRTPPEHLFPQLLKVLVDLHQAGMVLGDFRLQNMIWTEEGEVKLIDFDWSGRYDVDVHDTHDYIRYLNEFQQKLDPGSGADTPLLSIPRRGQSARPIATYPFGLSDDITWHPEVQGGGANTPFA